MKKRMLRAAVAALMVLCVGVVGLQVQAAGPRDGETVDGSLLTSGMEVSDSFENVQRTGLVSMGVSRLAKENKGLIFLSGSTTCFRTCDSVKVYFYLEQLVGDTWKPVIIKRKTAANAFFVDNGIDLVVDSGYYYRIRGSHLAILGSESDAGYTVTNGLYID